MWPVYYTNAKMVGQFCFYVMFTSTMAEIFP